MDQKPKYQARKDQLHGMRQTQNKLHQKGKDEYQKFSVNLKQAVVCVDHGKVQDPRTPSAKSLHQNIIQKG